MNETELAKLEAKLWDSAETMRGAVSVSDYKFIVLGLIFLKYISDSFEEKYKALVEEGYGLEEERDCYVAENIFYVPKEARWEFLVKHSKDDNIGEIIDDALTLIEKENKNLKDVLPKNYNSPEMRNVNLGELIDLFTNLKVGTKEAIQKDILGRIYEYFLGEFAKNELQKGGEFYTPSCIVRTMVEMIEPYSGRVYDPCCGSGGMFVQSLKFVENHQGNISNIGIFGQEKNPTTWKLAKMNLAIRSLHGDLGKFPADTFTEDLHKDLTVDYILANPPFNLTWNRNKLMDDPRWKYGVAPENNANYAWLQHMISKLSSKGKAAIILHNGSLTTNTASEGDIRRKMIEDDIVECVLAMPTNLFYTVSIPCSIWILNKNKSQNTKNKVLFINAMKLGTMINRKIRELDYDNDIMKIANTYHDFQNNENFESEIGFSRSVGKEELASNSYILSPARYVGKNIDDNEVEYEERMEELKNNLKKYFEEFEELKDKILDKFDMI